MRSKILIIAFLVSLPFWWGVNLFQKNIENFLFWQQIAENPRVLAAQINQQELEKDLRKIKPIKNENWEKLEIGSQSAISFYIPTSFDSSEKILFQKAIIRKRTIASLTKLMTAYIVLKNYDIEQIIKISKEAVEEEGNFGKLRVGEKIKIKDLLYILLIESSNDAAFALANDYNDMTEEIFIELMNLEAKNLGMENTYFINSTGLDPDNENEISNLSTAKDLVKLTKKLLEESLIWEILSTTELNLYTINGDFHHQLQNTNELILNSEWQARIIGGKTGWTPKAQECLLLVTKAPKDKGVLINVILGSENRFEEMETLLNWIQKSYNW